MTVTSADNTQVQPADLVTLIIDGIEVSVPKGTMLIRAAEQIGIDIPRFCDHPGLKPVGACRQCLVEVATAGPDGSLRPMPKPQASCSLEVAPGMVVRTQKTSPVADKAQRGVMELLLINHPLDCPVCDKGGECPLQNQAMAYGQGETQFSEAKRTFEKPIRISTQVLLDRERCILCQRCTRFSEEIAGDPFIDLQMRGSGQQVGAFLPDVLGYQNEGDTGCQDFASYFSGNTVQICPVGALTAASYRFRARPFDLVSTPSICEHCASGCALRVDQRRGEVVRRLALADPQVNEEWNCDKGRWAFAWLDAADRLQYPLIRDTETGELQPVSWPQALAVAAEGLARHRGSDAGIITGGRITVEDAQNYAAFARNILGTNNIDFRSRAVSDEETAFLARHVYGASMSVTYQDLEAARNVVLISVEPEEESPMVFLRLRKAAAAGAQIRSVAAWASPGLTKLGGQLLMCVPGEEPMAISQLTDIDADTIVVVGERLAAIPGGYDAVSQLVAQHHARLAWIPRRAGDRGAVVAGAFPVAFTEATGDLAQPGKNALDMVQAACDGQLRSLVIGGVDPSDFPDPSLMMRAVAAAQFVVSLEVRASDITEHADVVFPVAPVTEKGGTYLTWEGRERTFPAALNTHARSDARVLELLAEQAGTALPPPAVDVAPRSLAEISVPLSKSPTGKATAPKLGAGQAILATWKMLIDDGRLCDGEPHLAGTARRPVARINAATARTVGVGDGDVLSVSTEHGAIIWPVQVTDTPENVVWLPTNSGGQNIHVELRAQAGDVVQLQPASTVEGGQR